MNPTAIFSKSGKGVQEASGKTSQLSRPDRAVLSAIDGRATLADVAGKVGKQFDNEFQALINKLDKDGFIREVSPGAAAQASGASKPAAAPSKPASKPTAPMDMASDLDFTAAMAAVPKTSAPAAPPPQVVARAPAPPPKPTVAVPPKPPPPSAAEQAKQAQIAKEQQSAFAKAREEAERKQQEERDRLKSEAEAKIRAETEAKLRAEAEDKAKLDAEAKAKKAEAEAAAARSSAIRAAAEAKIKAEAEAKRAKEEAERARREAEEKAEKARQEVERARKEAEEKAERARKEAEEKAERARREAEEKARREQEELKRKLEEERKAREEAERKAKEEAERARREIEEERRKLEEERKQREEESRREEEERAARRKREDEEEQERRRLRDEQEETERAARRKLREEEEEQARAAKSREAAPPPPPPPPPPAPKKAATGDAFADSLLADLDSFTQRDDDDRKAKEDSDRKAKDEIARKKQEDADRQEREAAEAKQREEAERRRKDEEAQRARDDEERRARKQREEREQVEREAEERRRKVAASAGAAPAAGDDLGITDDDLELDEVKQEAAILEKKKNRKEEREKEREKERAQKKEREREAKSKKEKEREEKESKKSAAAYRPRRKSNLGRNLFVSLVLLLIIGAGVLHVMPVSTAEYERAATEALGRPVKIASGRFSAIGGVQYKFEGVTIGDLTIPVVRAYPELGSVFCDKKTFTRIELDGLNLPQDALGDVLFAKTKGDALVVPQLSLRNLKLSGALPLPPLDGEVQMGEGGLRSATLRGPEGLVAKLTAKDNAVEFDVNTAQFTLPFAQGITLVQFAMKGDATRQGLKISQWDGLLFSGHVTGTANIRWGNTWSVDGVTTARGVNAAVFAPALMSNGRAEGTGRFSMSGVEPANLGAAGRLEGSFTVSKGVLGSFDLSRALQTGGRQVTGQTQFAEMSGQGTYDRGAVSLRNINLGAGALNAGASADISETGAISGRIVADVKTSTQNVRSTLILGGTLQEPQVRN